jgi:hypothetical protein
VDGTTYCTPCLEKETGLKVRRAVMVTATAYRKGLKKTEEAWAFLDGKPTFGEILASNILAEVGCLPTVEVAKEIVTKRLKKWVGENTPITISVSEEVEWEPLPPDNLSA